MQTESNHHLRRAVYRSLTYERADKRRTDDPSPDASCTYVCDKNQCDFQECLRYVPPCLFFFFAAFPFFFPSGARYLAPIPHVSDLLLCLLDAHVTDTKKKNI